MDNKILFLRLTRSLAPASSGIRWARFAEGVFCRTATIVVRIFSWRYWQPAIRWRRDNITLVNQFAYPHNVRYCSLQSKPNGWCGRLKYRVMKSLSLHLGVFLLSVCLFSVWVVKNSTKVKAPCFVSCAQGSSLLWDAWDGKGREINFAWQKFRNPCTKEKKVERTGFIKNISEVKCSSIMHAFLSQYMRTSLRVDVLRWAASHMRNVRRNLR